MLDIEGSIYGGGIRNRTCVRFPKRIAIEPAGVRVFGLMSFFPRECYQLKRDADWVGERGSSRYVEPKFNSAFRNRTRVRIDLSKRQISSSVQFRSIFLWATGRMDIFTLQDEFRRLAAACQAIHTIAPATTTQRNRLRW